MVVNNKEKKMQPDDLIVSKTDAKGHITYCNDAFMEFTGYYEEELLGQSHSMVNHPDMPKAVFDLMHRTIQNENEFLGFVKNIRKNGGFFWTFVNVTPTFNANSQLIGYLTVVRQPVAEAIEIFQPVYQQMTELESQFDNTDQAIESSSQILHELVATQGGYDAFISHYYI